MLVDTDVLIWYMRGDSRARKKLDSRRGFSISAVTYMELVQGARSKAELRAIRAGVRAWNADIVHVTSEISSRAVYFVEQHFHAHALRLADALIGATAIELGLPLLTANAKHYKMLNELELITFRPAKS